METSSRVWIINIYKYIYIYITASKTIFISHPLAQKTAFHASYSVSLETGSKFNYFIIAVIHVTKYYCPSAVVLSFSVFVCPP